MLPSRCLPAISVLSLLCLAACAPTPRIPTAPDSTTPTASAPSGSAAGPGGQTASQTRIDALPQPTLTIPPLAVNTQSNWEPRVHMAWPATPQAPGLDRTLQEAVETTLADATTAAGGVAQPELTGTWSLVANSPNLLGVRLTTTEFAGASTGFTSHSYYGPAGGEEAWRGRDLVTTSADARLVELAQAAVTAQGWATTQDPSVDDLLEDVSFGDDGAMHLVVGKGALASADHGLVHVVIDRASSEELLTDEGRRVREAVMAADAPPSASTTTPAPTSTSATSAATHDVDCNNTKCIALTFDDGPGKYTSEILDALQARKARATFFVLGPQVEANPDVVRRAHEAGMAIGDHTWTHSDLARLEKSSVEREIARTADAIIDATGSAPVAVRPPYGSFTKATPHGGLPFVLWDVDTEDWKNRSSSTTTQRALAGAHPGAIILMHDIHPSTAKAVPTVVDGLQAKGYTLVTVPELLGTMQPSSSYYSAKG